MDDKPIQHLLKLKEKLVDLEDEHKHLKSSKDHLEQEIQKRELKIQKLLAERELELAKEEHVQNLANRSSPENNYNQAEQDIKYSSVFTSQVDHLLSRICRTAEEVSSLVKL